MLTIMTLWLFCGILAVTVATSKGQKDLPTLFSCLALGPIGIGLAIRKKKFRMHCPYCDESVDVDKGYCSLCGLNMTETDRTVETMSKQCLICGEDKVHDAYIEDGSWGKWCPKCKMSIKRMREK